MAAPAALGALLGGGMPGMSASSSASAALNSNGSSWGFDNSGWTVNVGGSGTAMQAAAGGSSVNWLLIAAAAGAAWFLFKG